MEKKILKKRQSASQETKELSEQGAEKSNSGLITAGMLLYSKTELSEARGRLFLVESVDAETGEITALGLTTKAGTDDSLWEIARTEENKLFKPYLAQLEAQYIFSHDWPFVIQPQCVQKSQLEELLEAREQYKKDNKLRRIMMREAPLEGTDKLQQQIKEMCDNFKRDPKQYMEYLRFAGQFYQYSIRNRMLIYRQNPYATFVASRTAWNQKEAHILPDQQLKGISILRPITTELIKRENDWVAVRMATNEEREKIAKGELKIYEKTYFAISKVYDISQTDFPKDRYPEIYSMGQKSMDPASKNWPGQAAFRSRKSSFPASACTGITAHPRMQSQSTAIWRIRKLLLPCATSTHTACCTEPALSPRPFVNLRHKVWHSC